MNDEDVEKHAVKRARSDPKFQDVDVYDRIDTNGSWGMNVGVDDAMDGGPDSPGHTSGVVSSASDNGSSSDASSCSSSTPTPMAVAVAVMESNTDVSNLLTANAFNGLASASTNPGNNNLVQQELITNQSPTHRTFQQLQQQAARAKVRTKKKPNSAPLSEALYSKTRDGRVELVILNQPETQHRARYLTEGSRGAIKDRSGEGFPTVKLVGYYKPAKLEVFIGTDQGKAAPHMFYQACRVYGKNSTPCVETRVNGTVVLEIALDPSKDMTVSCDCIGILKERNVDVELRFPSQVANSATRKKSTRCRLVFRATVVSDDGRKEVLQVVSQAISCTQPPGVPEILKKSLSSCSVEGGEEMFIIGKNFLKDAKIIFRNAMGMNGPDCDGSEPWEVQVIPQKEYLHQLHLVCIVPSFKDIDTKKKIDVEIVVVSGGKTSEPHPFIYTPMLPSLAPLQATLPDPSVSVGTSVGSPETPLSEPVDLGSMNVTSQFTLQPSVFKFDEPTNMPQMRTTALDHLDDAVAVAAAAAASSSVPSQPIVQSPPVCDIKPTFPSNVSALADYVTFGDENRSQSMMHKMQDAAVVSMPYMLTATVNGQPIQNVASITSAVETVSALVDQKNMTSISTIPTVISNGGNAVICQQSTQTVLNERYVITQQQQTSLQQQQQQQIQQQQQELEQAVFDALEPTKLAELNIPSNVIITSAGNCEMDGMVTPSNSPSIPETCHDGKLQAQITPAERSHMTEIYSLTKRIQEHITSCIPEVAEEKPPMEENPSQAVDVANTMAAVYDSLRCRFPVDQQQQMQEQATLLTTADFCQASSSDVVLPATLKIEPCQMGAPNGASVTTEATTVEFHSNHGGKIIILSPTLDFSSAQGLDQATRNEVRMLSEAVFGTSEKDDMRLPADADQLFSNERRESVLQLLLPSGPDGANAATSPSLSTSGVTNMDVDICGQGEGSGLVQQMSEPMDAATAGSYHTSNQISLDAVVTGYAPADGGSVLIGMATSGASDVQAPTPMDEGSSGGQLSHRC